MTILPAASRPVCWLSLLGLMVCQAAGRVRADISLPVTPTAQISALNRAVENGDTATVKALLLLDPTLVNSHDNEDGATIPGGTPMDTAVFWRKPDMIALLLADKADINGKDKIGRRPLHIAVRYDDMDTLRLLLADGADVNAPAENGRTPLREALADDYMDLAKILLDHHAQSDIWTAAALGQADQVAALLQAHPEQASARDDLGRTPLHWAAHFGKAATAAALLAIPTVRVNAPDDAGDTPLHWAAMGGWDDNSVLKLLLAHGADVNARNKEGDTPLLATFDGPHGSFAQSLLIAHGTDVTIHGKYGRTALHYALFSDDDRSQGGAFNDRLIAHGADVNARDQNGQAPLHSAANSDAAVWASYLLSKGADVNLPDGQGETPLHLAVQADRRKSLAALLAARGVAIDARDHQGQTPLYEAARLGHTEIARLLLAAKADINARSSDGTTPLDAAVLAGHKMAGEKDGEKDLADLLLSAGAKVSIFAAAYYGRTDRVAALLKADPRLVNASHDGITPLHLAAEQGAAPLVALLLAHGADVNGASNMTPLMLAAERGHGAVVTLLLAHGADTQRFVPGTYATNVATLAEMLHHGDVAALIRPQTLRK